MSQWQQTLKKMSQKMDKVRKGGNVLGKSNSPQFKMYTIDYFQWNVIWLHSNKLYLDLYDKTYVAAWVMDDLADTGPWQDGRGDAGERNLADDVCGS